MTAVDDRSVSPAVSRALLQQTVTTVLTAAGARHGRIGVSGFLLRDAFPQEGGGLAVHYLDYDSNPVEDAAAAHEAVIRNWAAALDAAGLPVERRYRDDGVLTWLLVTGGPQ